VDATPNPKAIKGIEEDRLDGIIKNLLPLMSAEKRHFWGGPGQPLVYIAINIIFSIYE